MKVKYLPSAIPDLDWFKRYYAFSFPEGARKASASVMKARKLLADHPMIGRPSRFVGKRELVIGNTPFKFVYAVGKERVEIYRLIDTRSDDPEFWLTEE